MAVLEIWCIQGKRKPEPGCVSFKGTQWAAALQLHWATRVAKDGEYGGEYTLVNNRRPHAAKTCAADHAMPMQRRLVYDQTHKKTQQYSWQFYKTRGVDVVPLRQPRHPAAIARTFTANRSCTAGDTNLFTSPPSTAISRTKVLLMNWYLSLGVRKTVSTCGIRLRFMPAS